MSTQAAVGKPFDRVDGRAKVTGAARFAADFCAPRLAHAVLVQTAVAKGRVDKIDTATAAKVPGVLAVLTPDNIPKLRQLPRDMTEDGKPGELRTPLQDHAVHHAGQHLAVVVADTLERAVHAASLVRVVYDEQKPTLDLKQAPADFRPEKFSGTEELQVRRGDVAKALAEAAVSVEHAYETPVLVHNPIETGATVAFWDDDRLTLHETTRWLTGVQTMVAQVLGVPAEKLRVVCPFVGGAFGSKGFFWGHTTLAALAARRTGRPVKQVLTRPQMFTSLGRRARTVQTVALGATADGRLTALRHATLTETSPISNFVEPCGMLSRSLYACPNVEVTHAAARINVAPPVYMRAPGETPGSFALESAMDELAVALKIDPVELRIINHADTDQQQKKPYSSKHLKECYRQGAERFGWAKRTPAPGSMRDGDRRVGWGMATAFYPQRRQGAAAKAVVTADGRAVVSSGTHDVGSGSYTVMTQFAADALGLPPDRVRFDLGDTRMPPAPVTGGSWTTVSVGPAVIAAATAVKKKLIEMAIADASSPLHGAKADEVVAADGKVSLKSDADKSDSYSDILSRARSPHVEAAGKSGEGAEKDKFSFESFGAQFAEVKVDALGQVRVTRFVGVFDTGKIVNPKTARSQLIGGITMGIGMALMEQTVYDPRRGKVVTDDLAEYRLPVNADVPDIDVAFIDQPDPHMEPAGAHGLGEIGITGVAAAVANAVYHATGRRVRDLPIAPEKLL